MNMGINFRSHKVMTITSWLDKISWPDMSCWGVEVIKAILKCYWILICDYVDAFGTKVLVMGTICSRKTNLRFESHGWTSVEHDIWWKQQVKCLGARPLYWQIIFGHPLSGFVLKNGAPKVWKMLILKCPAMRNGTDLRRLPQGVDDWTMPNRFPCRSYNLKLYSNISPVIHRVSYWQVLSNEPGAMFKSSIMFLLLAVLTVHVAQRAGEFCPLWFWYSDTPRF